MSTRTTRSRSKYLEAEKKQSEMIKENKSKKIMKDINKIVDELSSSKKNNLNKKSKNKTCKKKRCCY